MSSDPVVLVIEDNDDLRELVTGTLRYAGYRVTEAATGEDGLAIAQASPPGLVILDLLLPGIDGWQVAAALRASDTCAEVPILVLSVLDPGVPEYRIDGYLVKPFTAAQIEQKARELAGPPEPGEAA